MPGRQQAGNENFHTFVWIFFARSPDNAANPIGGMAILRYLA
jgi:hypothetical protein